MTHDPEAIGATSTGCVQDSRPTLNAIRSDYRFLDQREPSWASPPVRILSNERYGNYGGAPDVEEIDPPRLLAVFSRIPLLQDFLSAAHFLMRADRKAVILVDGASRFGSLVCLFNSFLGRRCRTTLLWDAFVETDSRVKRWLVRHMILGSSLTVVFSRAQIGLQAEYLKVPAKKFIFVPYKANHSKQPAIVLPIGNYIFAGGNSKRDYATLFDAVRGTGIPVIVSTTERTVTQRLEIPANVVLVTAHEPGFARLTAGSRLVVVPITPGGVKGAGEASFCNAMWHGKPVIAADDVAASEYIEEGVTGYVVPSGDSAALRKRILELWSDPSRVEEMGKRAHDSIAANLTHEHFIRRLLALAEVLGASSNESEGTPTDQKI